MAEKQPIKKSVTTLSVLQLLIAFINGLFMGWMMLVGWFVFLWWQHDYLYANQKACMWLDAVKINWQQVLKSKNTHTQYIVNQLINPITTSSNKLTSDMRKQALQTNNALNNEMIVKQNSNNNQMKNVLSTLQQGWKKLANVLLYATTMLLINILLLILATPLFVLGVFVGLADGLMQRSIRKASLGRESAYLFHRLSGLFPTLLQFMIIAFVALSWKVSPSYFLVGMATVMGCWIAQTVSRFKKYL